MVRLAFVAVAVVVAAGFRVAAHRVGDRRAGVPAARSRRGTPAERGDA